MGYTLDATGKPVISATPTQTVVDMQVIADFAAEFANLRNGIATERTGLAPGKLFNGLHFFETDTSSLYVYNGSWKLWHRNWRAYTPTLTNMSGTPAVVARYSVAAGVVFGQVQLTLTGANMGTGPLVSLPVAALSAANKPIVGQAKYSDVSPGGYYYSHVHLETTTSVALMDLQTAGTRLAAAVNVSPTTPFTWASGDVVNIDFTYEAA